LVWAGGACIQEGSLVLGALSEGSGEEAGLFTWISTHVSRSRTAMIVCLLLLSSVAQSLNLLRCKEGLKWWVLKLFKLLSLVSKQYPVWV
jgi:hypothetical protein